MRYDSYWRANDGWDAVGNEWTATFNLSGQTLTTVAPATGQTGTHNSYSQAVYLYEGGPLTTSKAFDESGSTTPIRQTSYTYGQEGETLGVSGSVESTTVTHDALYRRLTLTDGNSHTTTYTYNDPAGYVDSVTFPDSHTELITSRDAVGRPLHLTDRNGVVNNIAYGDAAGLASSVTYTGHSSENVSVTYDTYSRLTSISGASGTYSVNYGDLGELVSATRTYSGLSGQTFDYTYYPNGSRSGLSTPAGDFAYDYNAAGRPVSLVNPSGETTTWNYYDNNWLAKQENIDIGTKTERDYNAIGELTALDDWHVTGSGNEISKDISMTYDGVGNRTEVYADIFGSPSLSGDVTYTYDSKDRLIQEASTRLSGFTDNYTYDGAGNATTFAGTSRSYNSSNQISATGFVYDNDGNPTTYNGATCTYDIFHRATSLGSSLTNGYREDGLRAWKDNGTTRTYYLYDGSAPIIELNSSGTVTAINTFGVAGLVSRHNGTASTGSTVYYMFDERGNVAERLDGTGASVSWDIYTAYGTKYTTDTTGDPFGFGAQAGYYTDNETSLVLCGHRFYDPAYGRWLNPDPIGYAGGINVYAYCGNNPIGWSDSSGFQAQQIVEGIASECPALEGALTEAESAIQGEAQSLWDQIISKIPTINPGYSTNAPGTGSNCMACAQAVMQLVQTGQAQAAEPGAEQMISEFEDQVGSSFQPMTVQQIANQLNSGGSGTAGYIYAERAVGQAGHFMVGANIDGITVFLDGQRGTYGTGVEFFENYQGFQGTYWMGVQP